MKFTCKIDMNNAAFQEYSLELNSILEIIEIKVENGIKESVLFDTNGNKVGSFKITGKRVKI